MSALLAPTGGPAQILEGWAGGQFDVIVSPLLVAELERVLRRPKFKTAIPAVQIDALLSALSEEAVSVADSEAQPGVTPDPGDDYLIALARAADAECIVSGDTHLTQLSDPSPSVLTPREFLNSLGRDTSPRPSKAGTPRGPSVQRT
jgi:putative PIN family toxin of toxin-antitoxin system